MEINEKRSHFMYCSNCNEKLEIPIERNIKAEIPDRYITCTNNLFFNFKIFCPHCKEEMVEIDADIADIVFKLNDFGYKTLYCCQGHNYTDMFSNMPYIMIDCGNDRCRKILAEEVKKNSNNLIEIEFVDDFYGITDRIVTFRINYKDFLELGEEKSLERLKSGLAQIPVLPQDGIAEIHADWVEDNIERLLELGKEKDIIMIGVADRKVRCMTKDYSFKSEDLVDYDYKSDWFTMPPYFMLITLDSYKNCNPDLYRKISLTYDSIAKTYIGGEIYE